MEPERLSDFLARVADYQRANPMLRKGQALFNVLHEERPEMALAVLATPLDPHRHDYYPSDTLAWIEEQFRAEVRPADG